MGSAPGESRVRDDAGRHRDAGNRPSTFPSKVFRWTISPAGLLARDSSYFPPLPGGRSASSGILRVSSSLTVAGPRRI